MSGSEPQVFIVEDDPHSRAAVNTLVRSMHHPSQTFASAEQFLDVYTGEPGCLVSELMMPGLCAIELLDELRSRDMMLPTIVVSAFAEVSATVEVIRRGAVTLLDKPYHDNDLWDAIEAGLTLNAGARQGHEKRLRIKARMDTLSDNERIVMELILDGLPNKVIAASLDVSVRTIENRRRNVFQKMNVDSVAQLVQNVVFAKESRRTTA